MVKLGHTGTGTDRWALEFRPGNDPASASTTVSSINPAQTNAWTHLAGVYDSGAQQVRLYVNGDLQGSAAWTTPWPATHEFAVGRAIVNSVAKDTRERRGVVHAARNSNPAATISTQQ